MPQRVTPAPRRLSVNPLASGFTLVELLVVIGIIVILISILIPAVARVRNKARDAANRAWMSQLAQAIDSYNTDFRSYPGPLSNDDVYNSAVPVEVAIDPALPAGEFDPGNPTELKERLTMSENLVLGLLGGLRLNTSPSPRFLYDPRAVGSGASSLGPRIAKRSQAYLEAKNLSWRTQNNLKTGQFKDEGGSARDTIIPEFVDTYPDPLPILFLRAKKGSRTAIPPLLPKNNSVITYDPNESNPTSPDWRLGHYDLHQIIAYTGETIGVGRQVTAINPTGKSADNSTLSPHGLASVDPAAYLGPHPLPATSTPSAKHHYPYDAYPYLRNGTASSPAEATTDYDNLNSARTDVPHQKDGYILISAGLDRVYGTKDDVTNFGAVGD